MFSATLVVKASGVVEVSLNCEVVVVDCGNVLVTILLAVVLVTRFLISLRRWTSLCRIGGRFELLLGTFGAESALNSSTARRTAFSSIFPSES